jgi:hypothetical protein
MNKLLFLLAIPLFNCIGTDLLDDPIVPPTIVIDQALVTLLVNDSQQLTFTYTNEYGIEDNILPTWMIENTQVATVNTDGKVTAISKGQTILRTMFEGTVSNDVLINVAENMTDVAEVIIEEPTVLSLGIGANLQLIATAWNLNNMLIEGLEIFWEVDNESIATIDQTGVLEGKANGTVQVTATIGGVKSAALSISVGSESRSGVFTPRNGYKAEGAATLQKDENGDVILTFSSDFNTSFALGTFIYMSNSESGSDTKANGLELGEIKTNGAKTFNISIINANADLGTYQYVIVLCKPASITFGVADLN